MSRFNLIDEPWIPVRGINGNRRELGIKDTLIQAKALSVIEAPSPLVTAALHRFLLAILYRALMGPTDLEKAKELFQNGLPTDQIEAYLKKWRDRFWLFDNKYPFGQIPEFKPEKWHSWAVLAAENNADNAKVLFDHVDVREADPITEGAAVRWLLATQTFSVSCGKSELAHTGTAPSATAAMVLPLGMNLHDTLLLSLVPQNRKVLENDLPLWEREPETIQLLRTGPKRRLEGFADRYTWRIRAVKLLESSSQGIQSVALASGVWVLDDQQMDPMLAYRIDETRGKLPIQFRDRGLWRDFDSLLPDNGGLAPGVIEHSFALTRNAAARSPQSIMVLGQSNDQAKIEFWRMERFALPPALIGNRKIRGDIRRFLDEAEETQRVLWSACKTFADLLLGRGERRPKSEDIRNFISQMPSIPWYWSTLEGHFHDLLGKFTLEKNLDEIEKEWLCSIRNALVRAWGLHAESVRMGNAWEIRALVNAQKHIEKKRREMDKMISEFENIENENQEDA